MLMTAPATIENNVVALFDRDGEAPKGPVQFDEKGKPYWMQPRKCTRCGGAGGSDAWIHTGRTCYDCGGSGTHKNGPLAVSLYTAEQNAKLDATRDKARAKKKAKADAAFAIQQAEAAARKGAFMAEHGDLLARADSYLDAAYPLPQNDDEWAEQINRHGHRDSSFIGDIVHKARSRNAITPGQIEAVEKEIARWDAMQAAKRASQYVGEVGERLTLTLEVVKVIRKRRACFNAPWDTEILHITKMRDEAGNTFMVFSTSFRPRPKAKIALKATVKDHDAFDGENQTKLFRPKITETLVEGDEMPSVQGESDD